jgi:hypothetical protein
MLLGYIIQCPELFTTLLNSINILLFFLNNIEGLLEFMC